MQSSWITISDDLYNVCDDLHAMNDAVAWPCSGRGRHCTALSDLRLPLPIKSLIVSSTDQVLADMYM